MMRRFSTIPIAFLFFSALPFWPLHAQILDSKISNEKTRSSDPTIALRASSTMNLASEMGGAFMSGLKCDADGNLYIRKFAMDRPQLAPVAKIDRDGKRTALFDPAAFSGLKLDRADSFSPASDGGIYQIAESRQSGQTRSGVSKSRIYVLHFSSDGSPSSPAVLDADLEVYTFAAFTGGNFLISGVRRDLQNKDAQNKNDHGRSFTAVFSADGRELAQLSLQKDAGSKAGAKPEPPKPMRQKVPNEAEPASASLDLADAEVGDDGNLYGMRAASPALIYVISPGGKVMRTLKIPSPLEGAVASVFHVSGNRMAVLFSNADGASGTMVVADAQTGREVSSYADPEGLGPSFACYSANDGVFTFLKLGEGNAMEVIRAEAQ